MRQTNIAKAMFGGVIGVTAVLASPGLAFAHVVVTPNQALTGAYETFTTSVPNEKDSAVTGIRLLIPDSIDSVTPTVKPGWEIRTKKSGDKITEISWTGGTIAPELRDVFTFSAHMPADAGDIDWRAYQTYADGSVVAWDQTPSEGAHHEEDENKGPYSVTTVSSEVRETSESGENASNVVILYSISLAALVVGVAAFVRTFKLR